MKLLIVTQVIDTEHPILGFFHRWVAEFAAQCESVEVICQATGQHNLPENVTVHSLGKEDSANKLVQLWRFYRYSWQLRQKYDAVFVHMIPLYVILGGPLWRFLGKKVGLWYAHGTVTASLHIATLCSHYVFTSTPQGFRIDNTKKKIVGQGIDTQLFRPLDHKLENEVLQLITVGRITQSKNIETLLRACAELKKQSVPFVFTIVGSATNDSEQKYYQRLLGMVSDLKLESKVVWLGPVSNESLPQVLQQADVFIHDGSTGSLDKALLEAVSCGCVVISSNESYVTLTKKFCPELLYESGQSETLASIIKEVNELGLDDRASCMRPIVSYVSHNYSISSLMSGIVQQYKIR